MVGGNPAFKQRSRNPWQARDLPRHRGARRAVVWAAGVGTKVITERLAVSMLFVCGQLGVEPAQKPREEAQRLG